MRSEDCLIGTRVRFTTGLFKDETGVVVAREASDEALVRFDIYRPEYDHYDDTRTGAVTVDPNNLILN